MKRALKPGQSRRQRFVLRGTADLDRMLLRLLVPWRTPHVALELEALSDLVVQRAQDRLSRLADGCNCLLGEMLGAAMLLIGVNYVWVISQQWSHLGWVAVATLAVGVAGKVIELAWTRLRMMAVLVRLRFRIDAARRSGAVPAARPARTAFVPLGHELLNASLEADTYRVVERSASPADGTPPSAAVAEPPTTHVLLRDVADIDRLLPRLKTFRALPGIDVRMEALPALEVQRAQHRIVDLSRSCNCVLAAVFAGATLILGGFYMLWMAIQKWDWYLGDTWSWGPAGLLGLSVVGAGALGWVVEVVSNRMKLVQVLRHLRDELSLRGT